jgi:hypothetical protein
MMLHENEKSGHRDIDGNWIDETPTAKLRNSLQSFWTLSTILSDDESRDKFLKTDDGIKVILEIVQNCEKSKERIIQLLIELEK